ncbi:type II secretion system protein GspM [Aliidiomarina soli]|uniref:Type II secretion system protein M n=1 Tax=Aliidiomarina soli TaxID=1928574 RepID=A0A432WCA6_9GAMM|nr:type II secretion system protein M [Aliidiomarina soli]RUO29688.1 hypothetical protein CWE14_14640 [Aliidiomarina soli]
MDQFKQYKQQARLWWQKREPRERQLLVVLAALLVIFIFWYGLWQPLQSNIVRAENRLATQQETLRWVEENAARVEQLRQQSGSQATTSAEQPVRSGELNAFISRTSTEFNLQVSRLQPQSDSLLVVFNDADFDQLLRFIAELESRAVQVNAVDIAEGDEPGMVRVRRLEVRAEAE